MIFDTETTGLNVFEDDVVQIAAIKVKDHDWGYVDPNRGLEETDLLMVLLEKKDINKWR